MRLTSQTWRIWVPVGYGGREEQVKVMRALQEPQHAACGSVP